MLYYEEVFVSIQGESRDTGLPCIFIRTHGCPFKCKWCDQPQDVKDKKRISVKRLVSKCVALKRETGVSLVCITGGEPLIYANDIYPLIYELQDNGFKVSIETSGLVNIESTPYKRSYRYIMDIKCPSSEMSERNKYDNLLMLKPQDDVVFVIQDQKDYEFMRKILRTYPTSAQILASPVFLEGKPQIGKKLVSWLLQDKLTKVRVQVQVHKVIGVL